MIWIGLNSHRIGLDIPTDTNWTWTWMKIPMTLLGAFGMSAQWANAEPYFPRLTFLLTAVIFKAGGGRKKASSQQNSLLKPTQVAQTPPAGGKPCGRSRGKAASVHCMVFYTSRSPFKFTRPQKKKRSENSRLQWGKKGHSSHTKEENEREKEKRSRRDSAPSLT